MKKALDLYYFFCLTYVVSFQRVLWSGIEAQNWSHECLHPHIFQVLQLLLLGQKFILGRIHLSQNKASVRSNSWPQRVQKWTLTSAAQAAKSLHYLKRKCTETK